jgi:hypothetical protein
MTRNNTILGIALIAQLGLAGLTWSIKGASVTNDATTFLSLQAADVTELTVVNKPEKGAQPAPLVLAKRGDAWVVASADGYPAQTDKVQGLIDKLVALKVREPVATQITSHNALKVGEHAYDKRLTIKAGEAVTALVVGGAKGDSIHLRREGDAEVLLARGISAWAISDRVSTYVDTQYIKVDEPDRVTVRNRNGTITLVKGPQGWSVDELPADVQLDDTRVQAFVAAARAVQLVAPLGKTLKPEYGLDRGTVVEVIKGEATTSYTVGALAGENHYLKAADNPYVITVGKFAVETLLTQTPDQFIKQAGMPQQPPPGGMRGMPPGMRGMPPGMQGMPPGMPGRH